ncbi:hypothetical protein Jolie1_032 [Mycobacterium phage Julie1]|uniref:Minor tail protein n=1 Tax=Mycobacterium phage Julie1 TaxID=1463812 RepID=W8EB52_9CAUD|nr:hypothetical protein CG90_gp32 [Mycobacterium phage Julie1]AHJ88532.1 hypothetical protein Jolie1_032 [Mycobacterium phage Julie1]
MTAPLQAPIDENHFQVIDGVVTPQPWMQWRNVGGIKAPSRSAQYGVTLTSGASGAGVFGTLGTLFGSLFSSLATVFGASSILAGLAPSVSAAGNKNQLIHKLQRSWTNNSPVDQWVYGMITRGGCRVSLQARSRGGLVVRSGQAMQAVILNDDFGDPSQWPLTTGASISTFGDDGKTLLLAGGNAISFTRQGIFPVTPGETVVLSARARRDNAYNGNDVTATTGYLVVRNQANTSSPFGGDSTLKFPLAALPANGTWYTLTKTFVVPAGVTGLRVAVGGNHTAGALRLDDVKITRGTLEPVLVDASMFGIGGDIGRGGTLAIGTEFGVMEQRMNSVTFPLAPERVGWTLVPPGGTFVGAVELRFISEFWENTSIDGGDSGTESSFDSGETRLDLFAVPVL